jgi:ribonucleoside-diphosphate reductase subunit M2
MSQILFEQSESRFVLFPLKSPEIFKRYKLARDVFWVPNEINIEPQEIEQFQNLKIEEKNVILKILAFFANADNIVIDNLLSNFCNDVKLMEAKLFFSFQAAIESIHSEMYALLINAYAEDNTQKMKLFNSIQTDPIVKMKTDFAIKWMHSDAPFSERATAFACLEGILFSSSFAFIYYFKKRNLLNALTLSNEFISRDEKMHADFAIFLVNMFKDYVPECDPYECKPSSQTILQIVQESVEIESFFVKSCLQYDLIGLSSENMIKYVKFVADKLLTDLKCEKFYKEKNPLDFMRMMSLDTRTNFFESRSSQYQKINDKAEKFVDVDF